MTSSGGQWEPDTIVGQQTPRSITLAVKQGPNVGQTFTVSKDQITIGRSSANDIAIGDQEVSRHHATISWENGQFVIRDMGSSNGTTVNGTRLTAPCPLRSGDLIGLGSIMLNFQQMGVAPLSAAETYARPLPATTAPPTVPQPYTVPMSQSTRRKSGGISTAAVIGIVAVMLLGLLVVTGIIFFFLMQNQGGPKISVQQPPNGSQAQAGQPVAVLASVKDPKGVTRVEFLVDGAVNATVLSSVPGGQPELLVQQSWTPLQGGVHNLALKAYSADGKSSDPLNIVVNVTGSSSGSAGMTPIATSGPAGTSVAIQITLAAPPPPPPPDAPTLTPVNTIPPPCTNNASFVADVTVPDNSVFNPGDRIDKTWRLRNSGTCPWQSGYQLAFVSGNKMGAPDSQAVVPTAPGGTADVTVTMYAPPGPGVYKSVWRMVTNTGQAFGSSFTAVIQVPYPTFAPPTFTPTSPPPPPGPAPYANLTVDQATIAGGSCTKLRANVSGVTAAWLDGEPVVGGYKEKDVCPCGNTTYNLEAAQASGPNIYRSVPVLVTGSCPTLMPDLVVRDLVASDETPLIGWSTHFKMRIKNQGLAPAGGFNAAWQPEGAGSWIIVGNSLSLNPGQDQWLEWDYTYGAPGPFNSKGRVDYSNSVPEMDEGNNEKVLTMSPNYAKLPILTGIIMIPTSPIMIIGTVPWQKIVPIGP